MNITLAKRWFFYQQLFKINLQILSKVLKYVGKRGFPESLLNYWYLYVILDPIFGGFLLI